MRKRYLLIPLFLLGFAGLAYTIFQKGGHEFREDQCPECHAAQPVKGRRETLKMVAPVSFLCRRCHGEMEDGVSHPVEIVPVDAVLPADFPLSWEGKMTCSTCHDIHASRASSLASFGAPAMSLRRPVAGAALCSACHGLERQGSPAGGHALAMGKAHMRFKPDSARGTLDPISRECLSCHDGSLGSAESVGSGMWEHGAPLSRFDPRGGHPVGVDYMLAKARRGGLLPVGALNPAIKLIEGKVSCSSCHDPYSRERKKLVMSMSGSKLCLSCHDK